MASPVSASDVLMQQDTHQHLRIVAIFVIFVSSLVGVLLPVAFRSRKEGLAFSFVKQIGSGVVLATGVVHVLPDANAALSDPALGECCCCASSVCFARLCSKLQRLLRSACRLAQLPGCICDRCGGGHHRYVL